MMTSVSKLLANRANAQKSAGPKSKVGKQASSNLKAELVNDARRLGYSDKDAAALVDASYTNRSVILAKYATYVEQPIEGRMPNMTME
jgi:hypothetical protein